MNNLFQNIDNTWKKSSTPSDSPSKGLSSTDPLSMIQAKPDTFDGLDPLSMFAAQEASTKQPVSVSAPVSKKQQVCIHYLQNILDDFNFRQKKCSKIKPSEISKCPKHYSTV